MENNLLNGYTPHPKELEAFYQQQGIWDNQPIWELITRNAKNSPNRCAVRDLSDQLTYAELVNEADSIAAGLVEQGYKAGERAILQWSNQVSFITALLGLFRAGMVPVLALPAHRQNEICHFAQVSGASIYITSGVEGDESRRSMIEQIASQSPTLRGVYSSDESDSFPPLPRRECQGFTPVPVDPKAPALFLVSGGTTGLPKLIPRTHNDYRYNITCATTACNLGKDGIYLAVLPAAHNFPLGCPGILGTLSMGGQVIFTKDASPDYCFELIERYGVTATALVPALAQVWTAATEWEDADLSSLRLLQVGGSKLSPTDAKAAIDAFPGALQQVFGMAEGLICYTYHEDNDETITNTQGRPMSSLDTLKVVDEYGQEVKAGEEGELLTRGPYTLRGYYRAEEHNRRAFTPDGFYRSGDRVRILDNGNIVVTGRLKDVVNRGGETFACDEIEEHLLAHPSIQQAAIIPLPDQEMGEQVGAAIVCADKTPSLQTLRDFLTERGLASFKLPEQLKVLSRLPVTAVGKVDKRKLLDHID
ncbi:2,3-dihydroxybenzoate-AMP ligase [Microbulbifer sp. A4B17]|uniref:(2,3-dihydroxybenzoyl)adenylate synthase n=1 Tax=Microbulbifer sp. A4B17 TaxID=359370 RepID=UPI000D52C903|nr:AMP-binding protein [Microbulbifer sp. A4B17]AWF81319.1 2,3-dihydroxybenzoate-AMP ligase [Microbulbifer sp. A4B17]